jgi:phage major head subunit gpT-like protein
MQITPSFMRAFSVGVDTRFNQRFAAIQPTYQRFSMVVNSTTRENAYPKLSELPGIREWIGDRVVHSLSASSFTIVNRTFEETLGISREDIEDDQFGLFNTSVDMLAQDAAEFPDLLTYGLLKRGNVEKCSDGQYFFDTDHQTYDASGAVVSASNFGGGTGTPWYLFDVSRPLRPLIFQNRRSFQLTAKTALDDDNVFKAREFQWGVDGRCNVGFGPWQLAYMSRQPLTAANYEAARAAMASRRRPNGTPLSILPNLLVVPGTLEGDGRRLLNSENLPNGESNPWKGSAELLVAAQLG